MSDFFANLAARARGSEDIVRPRLPSRFEVPESEPTAVPAAPLDVTLEHETPPAVRSRAAGDDAAPTARRSFAPPAASEAPASAATIAAQPIAQRPRELTPPAATSAAPATASAAAPVPAPATPVAAAVRDERRTEPRGESPHEHVVEPRVRRDPAARAPAADDAPRPDVARARVNREAERPPLRGAERAAAEIVPVAARAAAAPVASGALAIVPRVVRAEPQRSAPQAVPRAAETTVHVSIGRIEVRATPQAGGRRRDPAPAAVMSLGEYLSSRSERAR